MKLSHYLVITKPSDDYVLLFSTISRALIKLEATKYDLACKGKFEEAFSEEELVFLTDRRIAVSNDEDEIAYISASMNKDRWVPKVFSTYIALSTLCNFSCVYCYEKGQINKHTKMDSATLSATIAWYERIIRSNRYKKCKVCLYGGEPLLFESLLKEFIEKMHHMANNNSIELSFSMISNGYLFTSETCKYLITNGLEEIQITLDGYREVHNSRRMTTEGNGTFDTIISNILWTAKNTKLRIVVRISFDTTNVKEIKCLLKYLKSLDLEKRILLYFAPIHQTETQKLTGCSFCSQHIYEDYHQIVDCYVDLYTMSSNLGFETPTCYTNGPCMVVASDSCLLAPNGDLYKCVEMIGKKELCIGNVNDMHYNTNYYQFVHGVMLNECVEKGCIYVPLCGGGCTMEAFVKTDSLDNTACHEVIFKRLLGVLNSLKCGGETVE